MATVSGTSAINGGSLGIQSARDDESQIFRAAASIDWVANVYPEAIISGSERPDVENQIRQSPPGNDAGVPRVAPPDASGSAYSGWDISRQITQRVFLGPNLDPVVVSATIPSFYHPIDYPNNPVEGNDDDNVADEDDNPYAPGKGIVGQLISNDRPGLNLSDSTSASHMDPGVDGDRIKETRWFREFARIQIGNVWYRCSDYATWRYFVGLHRIDGKWQIDPNIAEVFDLMNTEIP
jgi:hypothetical protein